MPKTVTRVGTKKINFMKYTVQIGFLLLFMLTHERVFSQQLFNVCSHSAIINHTHFEYSIGEMSLITTERNTNLILTQGQLQPLIRINGLDNQSNLNQQTNTSADYSMSDRIKVYPNPTENILNIESIENLSNEISYLLFDALGKVILSEKLMWNEGLNKVTISLKNYTSGSYYLIIRKPNTNGLLENFSYKIQKIN